VRGPNTFRAALIDEVYALQPEEVTERVKLEVLDVDSLP
jgi:hydroxyethylthiazole kinase-like sugar kinase family protein